MLRQIHLRCRRYAGWSRHLPAGLRRPRFSWGIGSQRYRFQLRELRQELSLGSNEWRNILGPDRRLQVLPHARPTLPSPAPQFRVRLLTPLRLRTRGSYVRPAEAFGEFSASVLRRASLMFRFHGSHPDQASNCAAAISALIPQTRDWQPDATSLQWEDWTRYSNRQQTSMQMGGLLGHMDATLHERHHLWPWLWLGQFLHAGKASSMGLGAYSLERLTPEPNAPSSDAPLSEALTSEALASDTLASDTLARTAPSATPDHTTLPTLVFPRDSR